jgi:hypothetical protein
VTFVKINDLKNYFRFIFQLSQIARLQAIVRDIQDTIF